MYPSEAHDAGGLAHHVKIELPTDQDDVDMLDSLHAPRRIDCFPFMGTDHALLPAPDKPVMPMAAQSLPLPL